jgi:hypothetical protein
VLQKPRITTTVLSVNEEPVGKAVLKNIEDTPVKLTPVLHILKQ